MYLPTHKPKSHTPWNKDNLIGQKPPFKLKEVWAIRIHLQFSHHYRDLFLFNLATDGKPRACDLVKLRFQDVSHAGRISKRAIIMQQITQRPVQFEITGQTREAIADWVSYADIRNSDYRFKSRVHNSEHISTDSMRVSLSHGSLR